MSSFRFVGVYILFISDLLISLAQACWWGGLRRGKQRRGREVKTIEKLRMSHGYFLPNDCGNQKIDLRMITCTLIAENSRGTFWFGWLGARIAPNKYVRSSTSNGSAEMSPTTCVRQSEFRFYYICAASYKNIVKCSHDIFVVDLILVK